MSKIRTRTTFQTDTLWQLDLLEQSLEIRAKLIQHPLDSRLPSEAVKQMRIYIADWQQRQRLLRAYADEGRNQKENTQDDL